MVIVTMTGTPCSGKSTLAKMLAARLGYRQYSIGDLRRKMASEKGVSLAELNRLSAEGVEDTDTSFDEYQRALGEKEDDFVIDSRLGFHFIPQSVKLFVDADEHVRGERLVGRPRAEERALSVAEAMRMNRERVESDVERYQRFYKVNPFSKSEYDLVVDTSGKEPEELVEKILEVFPQLKPVSESSE